MKFSLKALMAMLLFCLPVALTSCGSDDDDDNGPKTYEYSWTLDDASQGSTVAEQQANLTEQDNVNKILAASLMAKSASNNVVVANSTKQTFSFTGTKSAEEYDSQVLSAFYDFKAKILSQTFENLPKSTKVTIKRGGKKVVSGEKIFN